MRLGLACGRSWSFSRYDHVDYASGARAMSRALATAALRIGRTFGVGGPSFTGTRPSGDGVTADVVFAALDARTIYFVPASLIRLQQTFPGVAVTAAPWFGIARSGVDLRAGDTYTDGTAAYAILGQPLTVYGFLLAPAAPCAVSEVVRSGWSLDFSQAGNSVYL